MTGEAIPMGSRFPALSIKQPWAELIACGRKTIEVRTWSTDHRGPLLIHVGRKPAFEYLAFFPGVDVSFLGGFIAVAELTDVAPFSLSSWSRLRPCHLVPGPMPERAFAWTLGKARRLPRPIAGRGHLGLFPLPPEVLGLIDA